MTDNEIPDSKILFVDDEENVLSAFRRNLRRKFNFETAISGADALEVIGSKGPFAVIVSDMKMPGMSGVEFLSYAAKVTPDSVRVMLTGNADQQTAIAAVNEGKIFRFMNKPCKLGELVETVEAALGQYELQLVERKLLEETVAGSVKALSEVLGMVAPFALGRGQRLQECITPFAKMAGVGVVWELEVAALLSSVGFASVPASVVRKIEDEQILDPQEAAIVRSVPRIGSELVAEIPRLEGVSEIMLQQGVHFENGESREVELPVGSRMLKILSDRMTLEKNGVVKLDALDAMKARPGFYDLELLELCFRCFPNFLGNSIQGDRSVLNVRIENLKAGYVAVSDIFTKDGNLLVGAGNRFTATMISRIQNYEAIGEVLGPVLVQEPN